jgi:hypothetical protein
MDCDCPIWIVGRVPTGDLVPRQATDCTNLKQAEAVRASLISKYSKRVKGDAAHGPTIAECAERYVASRQHELGEKTLGQHRLLLHRLTTFCSARGAIHIRDLGVDLLETFKVEGLPAEMASTSNATAIAKLRCFLARLHIRVEAPR